MTTPGKKLSFMGNEFGQFIEWNYAQELDWLLLDYEMHKKMQEYVRDLNRFYLKNSELWEIENGWDGFEWITVDDANSNVIVFKRKNSNGNEVIAAFNFSPVLRENYCFKVSNPGSYRVIFNSDSLKYGGSGVSYPSYIKVKDECLLNITLPPMSAIFIRRKDEKKC